MKNRTRQIIVGTQKLNIDFRRLQKQRRTLTRVIEGDIPDDQELEDLDGLRCFLDTICDAASMALGDEGCEVVFGESR